MFVILLVAGITIHRRAFELPVDMTRLTGSFCMPSFQFKNRKVVIKLGGRPAICCVTLAAIQPKAAFMRLIGKMT